MPPRAKPSSYPEPFLTRMAKREKRQLDDVFGCLLPALSSDLPRLDRATRERFALGVERLTGAIEALVAALGHAGAGEVASSTLAEMVGQSRWPAASPTSGGRMLCSSAPANCLRLVSRSRKKAEAHTEVASGASGRRFFIRWIYDLSLSRVPWLTLRFPNSVASDQM